MKLISLELRNFKGIKDLTIVPEGKDINIYGENASGKTTIFDAFMWLLFDKDSHNSSTFTIKTLDANGIVISGLEHEVRAVITIEGRKIGLQKIYKEKWTKKRGETNKALSGHTTDYFIDGVPKRKKDYTEFLENIIDEETFRILTNPLYFNTKLEWKKRRSIAMELVNGIENEDIFNKYKKLEELKDLLVGDLTVEDLKAKTQAAKRKLNQKLKEIPSRIDELSRQDLGEEVDYSTLMKDKAFLEKQVSLIDVNNIDMDKINGLKKEVSSLESWKRTFERNKTAELNTEYKQVNETLNKTKSEWNDVYKDKVHLTSSIGDSENELATKLNLLSDLRNSYEEIKARTFNIDENTCKSCGQDLQEDKKDENLNKFNECKEKQLSENIESGKKFVKETETLKEVLSKKHDELEVLELKLNDMAQEIESIETKLDSINKQLDSINFNEFEEYKENEIKITKLNADIESTLTSNKDMAQNKQDKVSELQEKLNSINTQLSKQEVLKSNLKRVNELEEEERDLAEQISQLEKTEIQCEQFVITKASLLEDKLNDKFKLVRFKLFNEQVNGGIEETFIATVSGVPYEDLNNAMKINAGLDIIGTLMSHYDFRAPIFADNSESVNKLIDIDTQIIKLIVSKDKELQVENNLGGDLNE